MTIMKKIFYLMLAVAAFAFVGCEDDGEPLAELKIVRSDIGFTADGGSGAITINTTEANFTATSDKDWIVVGATANNQVSYTVGPYDGALTRSGKITIEAGKLTEVVTIMQEGAFFDMSAESVAVDPAGLEAVEIPYDATSSAAPTVEIPADASWLRATVVEGAIQLIAELNYEAPRATTIVVKQAWKPVEIPVTQGTVNLVTVEHIETAKGSAYEVTITPTEYLPLAAPAWDVTTTYDWITIEKTAESFTVKLSENLTGKARNGSISLTDGGEKVLRTITVSQGFITPALFMGDWGMPCYGYDASGKAADIVADVTFGYDAEADMYYCELGGFTIPVNYVETDTDAYITLESQAIGRVSAYYIVLTLNSSNGYILHQIKSGYGIKFVYVNATTLEVQPFNNPGWPEGGETNGITFGAYSSATPSSSSNLGNWDMFRNLTTLTRK